MLKLKLPGDAAPAFRPEGGRVRVAPPIPLRGEPGIDRKLQELAPLSTGLALTPCPDPATFAREGRRRMPSMARFFDWTAGELALRRLKGSAAAFGLPPILLHGAPGMGKTYLARLIAELAGTPATLVNLGGNSDPRFWTGGPPIYAGAAAAMPATLMAREGVANLVFVLDEIDKAATDSRNGSLPDALLAYLEPASNRGVFDEFTMVSIDYSHVVWIATANDISRIPAPLRSRFHCFEVERPRGGSAEAVMETLLASVAAEAGLDPDLARALLAAETEIAQALAAAPSPRLARAILRQGLAMALAGRTLQ